MFGKINHDRLLCQIFLMGFDITWDSNSPMCKRHLHCTRTLSFLCDGAEAAGTDPRYLLDGEDLSRAIHTLSAGVTKSDGRKRAEISAATSDTSCKMKFNVIAKTHIQV